MFSAADEPLALTETRFALPETPADPPTVTPYVPTFRILLAMNFHLSEVSTGTGSVKPVVRSSLNNIVIVAVPLLPPAVSAAEPPLSPTTIVPVRGAVVNRSLNATSYDCNCSSSIVPLEACHLRSMLRCCRSLAPAGIVNANCRSSYSQIGAFAVWSTVIRGLNQLRLMLEQS